ncbi:MAG: efflux RND transporter permease subunit [Bacteroidales bacterium]|nr:efflux RND transporter permease subunit [Bacteroidales bacterium]MCF8386608.1 efflux RND transporter permease subunit [Bacteroidales bacterium]MCF8397724.1 efflux RND transporter permease subunit [Bacteroidales bacterium]
MKEMRFPRAAISNYQFTIIVFILLVIYGVSSYMNMPRTEDPEIVVPGATVLAVYPGASPVDLEELVAIPLEDAINELDDIKKINTTLRDGICIIGVEFIFGTDAEEKYDEVVQKVNAVKSELPDKLYSLETNQWTTTDVNIMQLALVSEDAEFSEMFDEADKIKKEIKKISGVKSVEIVACPEEEVSISLDLEKMARMNISLERVSNTIRSNNANIPGGNIVVSGKTFGVKSSGSFEDLEEISNTIVSSYQGKTIYLKDIARIAFDYEENKYYARFSGQRSIFMTVKQKEGLNVFHTTEKIYPIIGKYRKALSGEIQIEYIFDQAEQVDERIDGFIQNLLQGILLVGIVILLALGLRSSVIVIIAIPLSIIMGLGAIDSMGFGIQQISIAGLVVALGLLVDNSIVIVENINRFVKMGYDPREAAVKGTSQIGWAIISSTATTILAFVPIVMMPDKSGEFIKSLPVTIIATLVFSLLIALTLSPLIASLIFRAGKSKKTTKTLAKGFQKLLNRLIEGPYRNSLNFALNNRALTIIVAILVLGFSVFLFQFVGISFFPKAEKPQFMLRVDMPEGTSLDKTDEVTHYVESVLDTIPDVKYYASNVGYGNPRIYYNIWPKDEAKNYAEIFVQLHEYEVEEFYDLIEGLRDFFRTYAGAKITVKEFEQGAPIQAPVMIYVYGDNLDKLRDISAEVEEMVKEQAGAINIENQLSKQKTELYFNINREKAGMLGVPLHTIDQTIRTAVHGTTISQFRDEKGEEYDIVFRLGTEEDVNTRDFDRIYVTSVTDKQIPIKQLASIEFKEAPSLVTRYNLDRTALITADVRKGYTLDEIMNPVLEELDQYNFPSGYGYYIGGELESRQESFGGMQVAIVIALISIFAVLVLQFRSFVQPLIIYAAIPFALIGVIWALFITGYTFSFSAFIGLISLVGIVINNSIILVDYTNQLKGSGKSIMEALKEAGETRFTPIILTTLTTIGGLLPLTLAGGSMWAPMGWTIIGGLLVSTMLSLIVVPVLYGVLVRR